MDKNTQSKALEVIYTFFIGILVAVFVGVGIAAFYPQPKEPDYPATLKVFNPQIQPDKPTTASAKLLAEQQKYDVEIKLFQKKLGVYNRNVSIMALIGAIISLTISITYLKNLRVLADGMMLGGVFTLLYSVVRIFESGDDKVRFVVVSVGLTFALILGYIKFIKNSQQNLRS